MKQQLATIHLLCDWLFVGWVIPSNPASPVCGPIYVAKTFRTAVLVGAKWRRLMAAILQDDVRALRDRAPIAVLTFAFARTGAALQMRVEDKRPQGAG